jgi:hypothetical protein
MIVRLISRLARVQWPALSATFDAAGFEELEVRQSWPPGRCQIRVTPAWVTVCRCDLTRI